MKKKCGRHSGGFLSDIRKRCGRRRARPFSDQISPLPEACQHGRLKVCSINGDRKTCAKMAHLGLIPGQEIELLCKGGRNECMVKVNGGTVSLDDLTAANIHVAPL